MDRDYHGGVMDIDIQGADLLAAVQEQRNNAMDDAANNAAAIQALLKRIADLERQLADATKPAAEA